MKTEQEIKNMRNLYKEVIASGCKITNDNKSKQTKTAIEENKRIVKILDWVLEDSKPKRTIFDLTEDELIELAKIVMDKKDEDITYEICHYFKDDDEGEEEGDYTEIVYFLRQIPDTGKHPMLTINRNLDIYIFDWDGFYVIFNMVDYLNKITEMLNKPKEEVNQMDEKIKRPKYQRCKVCGDCIQIGFEEKRRRKR